MHIDAVGDDGLSTLSDYWKGRQPLWAKLALGALRLMSSGNATFHEYRHCPNSVVPRFGHLCCALGRRRGKISSGWAGLPFTILKIPKEGLTEVIGEFGTEAEADAFVLGVRIEDPDSDYVVEAPHVPTYRKPLNS